MKFDQSVLEKTEYSPMKVVSKDNFYSESSKNINTAYSLNSLQSELKKKDIEIQQLKDQLKLNKNTFNDLKQTKQNLFENIYAIENLEREKIAYTLHEGIGQDLASIRYMLKNTIEHLEAKNISTDNLKDIHNLLTNTIVEVKNVTYKIIPVGISKFGFIKSLESMIEDLNSHSSIKFTFYSNINEEILSINNQLSIYRIIQESINNIIKHAHSSEASIRITFDNNSLLVTIEDNGVGFNYHKKIKNSTSRGLKNILNRAIALNADLLIDSRSNLGTCIHVLLNTADNN